VAVAGATPGAAFAATWRDERGEVVGTTFGGTMCLWPRKPWRIRITNGDFEHVIRCGECPGCLEFERRRLAERLHRKYGLKPEELQKASPCPDRTTGGPDQKPCQQLFVIRIFAPIELHASIAHNLHRRRALELEPGMWRLGATSFAVLSRSRGGPPLILARMGLKFRIQPLRLSRGRRAFRVLTAGLLVAREIYGEQRNRFYARGLPKADRQKWEVSKIASYKGYSRNSSPRAWTGRRVVLVPPDVWRLPRADRRHLRGLLLRAPDPEGVRRVMGLVADTLRAHAERSHVIAPPKAVLTREQVVSWYQQNAERRGRSTSTPAVASDITPSSKEGGYVSSGPKQGELMPEELAKAGRVEAAERRKRRAIDESMAIIERMRKKSEGRT
jgi:hypothetical protein